jgi:hypothetical protein
MNDFLFVSSNFIYQTCSLFLELALFMLVTGYWQSTVTQQGEKL